MTEVKVESNVSGYGLVFKNVMKDKSIDIEAKALYAYLSSYAGASNHAFPGVDLICGELNISEKRFKKYRKQLEDAGYLTITRKRTSNGFSNNIYHINHKLLSEQNVIETKQHDNNIVSGQNVSIQNVPEQNVSEQNVSEQNVSEQNVSEQNVGTTINSLTINSLKNNKDIKNNSRSSKEPATTANDNPFVFYQEMGFGNLNAYVTQEMNNYIDDFTDGDEAVIASMKIALDRNRANWGFVKSILREWLDHNLKDMTSIRAYEKNKLIEFKSKGKQFNNVPVEKTPKWLEKQNNTESKEVNEKEKERLKKQLDSMWNEEGA